MNLFLILLNTGLLLLVLTMLWQSRGKPLAAHKKPTFVIDTSSLIDGRILKVVHAGFMQGRLLVPEFVLGELQHIADSSDELRRSRGREGLEAVRKLQAMQDIDVEVIADEVPQIEQVDDKLVAVAQKLSADIITNDYNLNKVATIKGVKVLNVNELSQALRPPVLPGERTKIKLVQPGSESNQAVGYLEDGTMVVVERANRLIGSEVEVEIHNIMQTQAGRMMFAKLVNRDQTK